MTTPTDTDSPSLKGPTVVLPLMKVTVVAGESVEMQVIVDGDPGVNSGGSLTVGPAGGRKSINHITDHKSNNSNIEDYF